MDCDPEFADTAAFCSRYGIDPVDSANTILVVSKRPAGALAACVALATTRLDVNRKVCELLGVKKASFASAEATVAATGMEIGGVTPFGLPSEIPLFVDSAVLGRDEIVVGAGSRTAKLRIPPQALSAIPVFRLVDGLAVPVED